MTLQAHSGYVSGLRRGAPEGALLLVADTPQVRLKGKPFAARTFTLRLPDNGEAIIAYFGGLTNLSLQAQQTLLEFEHENGVLVRFGPDPEALQ